MIPTMLLIGGVACRAPESATEPVPGTPGQPIVARTFNSGFDLAHDTYNGLSVASNGKVYYVLSSQSAVRGGQMYSFDPATSEIKHVADLTEACGEKGLNTIAQGKSHVNFVELDGKLYFSTHLGFYSLIDGMEKPGLPPEGMKPYPGGHLLAYDMATGEFEDLATAPFREGILTTNMDTARRRIYSITWPTGYFLTYDLATGELKNLGPISERGEDGRGPTYRTLCRSLAIDPGDGSVYFSVGDGWLFRYRVDTDSIEKVEGEDLRKDYFGRYDPTSPGHMGYNWRQVFWHPAEKAVYGVHGNSGYLFRFDPKVPRVDVLERLTSLPSKRTGMFDQFSYGYLGFILGPDGRTIHYLTGGPVYVDGQRVKGKESTAMGEAKGIENLHLVTYDIPTGTYADQGPVLLPDGSRPYYVNSLDVGDDGMVYTLGRITENGTTRTDLIAFPGPLVRK